MGAVFRGKIFTDPSAMFSRRYQELIGKILPNKRKVEDYICGISTLDSAEQDKKIIKKVIIFTNTPTPPIEYNDPRIRSFGKFVYLVSSEQSREGKKLIKTAIEQTAEHQANEDVVDGDDLIGDALQEFYRPSPIHPYDHY